MDNKKIIIGISGVVIVGVGIYLVTRKAKPTPPPNNLPDNTGLNDPTTMATDTLGGQLGNFFTSLIGNWNKSNNPTNPKLNDPGCQNIPADPYVGDAVNKANYSSEQIKKMQTTLVSFGEPISGFINNTGGIDGKIGDGFKSAYNTARKSCYITGISDLEKQSGI